MQQLPLDYAFAGLLIAIAVGMAAVMVMVPTIVSWIFSLTRTNAHKLETYECGITPTGTARTRFSIKFYVIAMLFILFDIEAIFLYPWLAMQRWLGWFGLIEMAIFVLILAVGYIYIWKRRALEWE